MSPFEEVLAELGSTPLPPYIKRSADSAADRERYQTIYSKTPGAIAAPTAGLHFTAASDCADMRARASVAEVTLHVGYGTFEPVRVDEVDQHSVSSERFYDLRSSSGNDQRARANGGRVIVVGTTTMRALESSATDDGRSPGGERRSESDDQTRLSFPRRRCTTDQLPSATLFPARARQRFRRTRARTACLSPRRPPTLPLLQLRRLHVNSIGSIKTVMVNYGNGTLDEAKVMAVLKKFRSRWWSQSDLPYEPEKKEKTPRHRGA